MMTIHACPRRYFWSMRSPDVIGAKDQKNGCCLECRTSFGFAGDGLYTFWDLDLAEPRSCWCHQVRLRQCCHPCSSCRAWMSQLAAQQTCYSFSTVQAPSSAILLASVWNPTSSAPQAAFASSCLRNWSHLVIFDLRFLTSAGLACFSYWSFDCLLLALSAHHTPELHQVAHLHAMKWL